MAARTYTLIRHGEAQQNVLINAGDKAAGRAILDPRLTELGEEQARSLGASLASSDRTFDLVVTSPLSRALQTTQLAFAHAPDARVVVTSLHTENGILVDGDPVAGNPCQRGRSVDELKAEFPAFDFGGVDATQWASDERGGFFNPLAVPDRLEVFRTYLHALPEGARVLVVGHSGFWKKLLGQEQKMANCEMVDAAL